MLFTKVKIMAAKVKGLPVAKKHRLAYAWGVLMNDDGAAVDLLKLT